MHRFNRGESPVDFEKIPREHKENWKVFGKNEPQKKASLRDALYERQHHYCAYCETPIKVDDNNRRKSEDYHIEHLESRGRTAKKSFDWNNLFLSCYNKDRCGKYKDDVYLKDHSFKIADIIDPSKENPLDFYSFNDVGEIRAVSGASSEIVRKVEETVNIFNLNGSKKLLGIRKTALREINSFMAPYIELEIRPTDDEVKTYLNNLPDETPCISVYYAYFDLRAEYEERFTSTRAVPVQ